MICFRKANFNYSEAFTWYLFQYKGNLNKVYSSIIIVKILVKSETKFHYVRHEKVHEESKLKQRCHLLSQVQDETEWTLDCDVTRVQTTASTVSSPLDGIPIVDGDNDSLGVGYELSARVNGGHHHIQVERRRFSMDKGDDHTGVVGLAPQHDVPCSLYGPAGHLVVEVKGREEEVRPRQGQVSPGYRGRDCSIG